MMNSREGPQNSRTGTAYQGPALRTTKDDDGLESPP